LTFSTFVTELFLPKWLGFGPEQASIPADFEIPVSSFAMYGGHASIHLRYDASSPSLLYNGKGDAPGNNIAYLQGENINLIPQLIPGLQLILLYILCCISNNLLFLILSVGVPTYRISQMVKNGGNVLDAFGIVNVVSPVGLPMRGIVGISPDPMMFIAINTSDMQGSQNFYETLGLTKQVSVAIVLRMSEVIFFEIESEGFLTNYLNILAISLL